MEDKYVGVGVGIFLVAVGAVLAFAVHTTDTGAVDIHTVGTILMVVGGLGVLLSLIFWSTWFGPGRYGSRGGTPLDDPRI